MNFIWLWLPARGLWFAASMASMRSRQSTCEDLNARVEWRAFIALFSLFRAASSSSFTLMALVCAAVDFSAAFLILFRPFRVFLISAVALSIATISMLILLRAMFRFPVRSV